MNLPEFLTLDPLGEIFLTGHRVCLHHVVGRYNSGASAEMLALQYPSVTLAAIHKVIAFYLENTSEVDAYVSRVRSEIEAQTANPSGSPTIAELRRRMAAMTLSKSA